MEPNFDHSSPRRTFLKQAGALSVLAALGFPAVATAKSKKPFFEISLAEWSFNRALKSGTMQNMDFPAKAKEFGIEGVEYVNTFFMDKVRDTGYMTELRDRCNDLGVKSLLIMCDSLGNLADTDESRRVKSVENHFPWVDAAAFLGCHSIRVNCAGQGTADQVAAAGIDGLGRLCEYASKAKLNVIVENHGGLSSNGKWLSNVIRTVGRKNCGTLPDFNNFNMGNGTWYDRYQGVTELMPFAKAVSAKTLDFDAEGNCVETDYVRMLGIVKAAGYRGYLGIEYEGEKLSEADGVRATLNLLKRVGEKLG